MNNLDKEPVIINRVAQSSLVSIDIESLLHKGEKVGFDLKPLLFNEMILKEKDFRESINQYNWQQYKNKNVYIYCSVDAIIPAWAYMFLATKLIDYANITVVGNIELLEINIIDQALNKMNLEEYLNKKVVVKGCSKLINMNYALNKITQKLIPVVSSLMFGETCSTVPIFKKH